MAHMLVMTTSQLSNPMVFLVFVIAGYGLFHELVQDIRT